jgi:hypothetical protein
MSYIIIMNSLNKKQFLRIYLAKNIITAGIGEQDEIFFN